MEKESKPAKPAAGPRIHKKVLPSNMLEVSNLPENFSKLMLEELVKNYQGIESIVEIDGPGCRAIIKFDSPDQAKFAVTGLNRFRVD